MKVSGCGVELVGLVVGFLIVLGAIELGRWIIDIVYAKP